MAICPSTLSPAEACINHDLAEDIVIVESESTGVNQYNRVQSERADGVGEGAEDLDHWDEFVMVDKEQVGLETNQ